MKIWERVVLRALTKISLPLAVLWVFDQVSIVWLISLIFVVLVWPQIRNLNNIHAFATRYRPFVGFQRIFILNATLIYFIWILYNCIKKPFSDSWIGMEIRILIFFAAKNTFNSAAKDLSACMLFLIRWLRICDRIFMFYILIRKHTWTATKAVCAILFALLLFYMYGSILSSFKCYTLTLDRESLESSRIDFSSSQIPKIFSTVLKREQGETSTFILGLSETFLVQKTIIVYNGYYNPSNIKRYNTEDVNIQCRIYTTICMMYVGRRYYWKHDGRRVRMSDRHEETTSCKHGILTMSLVISVIEDSDYGVYNCIEERIESNLIHYDNGYYDYVYKVTTIIKDEVRLEKYEPEIEVVYLPVSDKAFFVGHELLIHDETTVWYDYTINNKSFDSSYAMLSKCSVKSIFLFLFKELFDNPFNWLHIANIKDMYYINSVENANDFFKFDIGVFRYITYLRFCSNPNIYGWHRLTYLREHYNKTTKRTGIHEVQYPLVRLVLPGPMPSWIPSSNDTELYESFKSLILSKGPTSEIDQHILNSIHSNAAKARLIEDIVTVIVFLLSFFLVSSLIGLTLYYHVWVILSITKYIIKNGMRCSTAKKDSDSRENSQHYDVFIGHSDEDYDWVVQAVLPHIEKESGLSVCLPDRDCHGNAFTLRTLGESMTKSKVVLIILTDAFIEERCYEQQVECLLIPNLKEREKKSVLVLNCRKRDKQDLLMWHQDIDCIHWYDYSESERFKRLDAWLKESCITRLNHRISVQ